MNKPYICSYHVPISTSWESKTNDAASSHSDLEGLLRHANKEVIDLGETVLRLSNELKEAQVNKEVAEKKEKAFTTLIKEVSSLRREDPKRERETCDQNNRESANFDPRDGSTRRMMKNALFCLALLVLASVAVLVILCNLKPGISTAVLQITAHLREIVGLRSQ